MAKWIWLELHFRSQVLLNNRTVFIPGLPRVRQSHQKF